MNKFALLALDCSGSVLNGNKYFDFARKLVNKLEQKNKKITYVCWNDKSKIVSRNEFHLTINRMYGSGGTEPESVADLVRKLNFKGNLYLITDGQVYDRSIQSCDKRLGSNYSFSKVNIFLFETFSKVNLSVSCPFTRNSISKVFFMKNEYEKPCLLADISKEKVNSFDSIKNINTICEFEKSYDSILDVLLIRSMGISSMPELRNELLKLKTRLTSVNFNKTNIDSLSLKIKEGDVNGALFESSVIIDDFYKNDFTWEKKINRLISLTEGELKNNYDLSNIKGEIASDRARRADDMTSIELDNIIESENYGDKFECPILLSDENDVALLISDGDPIMKNLNKDKVNELSVCPLDIFSPMNDEILHSFIERIDHPISLTSYKMLSDATYDGNILSPMTRKRIIGCICLGSNEEHVKATNYTLSNIVSNGKCLGNINLWYTVLWYLFHIDHPKVRYMSSIKIHIDNHMRWRFDNCLVSLSLQGLPQYPTTKVPMFTAAWFTYCSSALELPPEREVSRVHVKHLSILSSLIDKYSFVKPDGLENYYKKLQTMMIYLSLLKKNDIVKDYIRGLYQNHIVVKDEIFPYQKTYIFIDGPSPKEKHMKCLSKLPSLFSEVPIGELIKLEKLDPNMKSSQVKIDYHDKEEEYIAQCNWDYGIKKYKKINIEICPKTCRPYFICKRLNIEWKSALSISFGVNSESCISINKYFGNYILENKRYPSSKTLLIFLNKKYNSKGTLPYNIKKMIKNVNESFKPIKQSIRPEEFIVRFNKSANSKIRQEMEKDD